MIRFLKIGSDPEFFIRDSETKEYLPSFYFTEGTKTNPLELGNDYKILKDNLVIEGNIPPAGTKEEWINNMLFLKNKIKEAISVISTAQIFDTGESLNIIDYSDEEVIINGDGRFFYNISNFDNILDNIKDL